MTMMFVKRTLVIAMWMYRLRYKMRFQWYQSKQSHVANTDWLRKKPTHFWQSGDENHTNLSGKSAWNKINWDCRGACEDTSNTSAGYNAGRKRGGWKNTGEKKTTNIISINNGRFHGHPLWLYSKTCWVGISFALDRGMFSNTFLLQMSPAVALGLDMSTGDGGMIAIILELQISSSTVLSVVELVSIIRPVLLVFLRSVRVESCTHVCGMGSFTPLSELVLWLYSKTCGGDISFVL